LPKSTSKPNQRIEALRLKHLRELLGLTQREISKLFRVSHASIALWESRKRTIPGPVLKLLDISEEEAGSRPSSDSAHSKELKNLVTSWAPRTLRFSKMTLDVGSELLKSSLKRRIDRYF